MSEKCENCGKVIGNLETPHLFKDHVVCAGCLQKLRAESDLAAKEKAGKASSKSSPNIAPLRPISRPQPISSDIPLSPAEPPRQLPPQIYFTGNSSPAKAPSGYESNPVGLVAILMGSIALFCGLASCLLLFEGTRTSYQLFLTQTLGLRPSIPVVASLGLGLLSLILGVVGFTIASGRKTMPTGPSKGGIWTGSLSILLGIGVLLISYQIGKSLRETAERKRAEQAEAFRQESRSMGGTSTPPSAPVSESRRREIELDRQRALNESNRIRDEILRKQQEQFESFRTQPTPPGSAASGNMTPGNSTPGATVPGSNTLPRPGTSATRPAVPSTPGATASNPPPRPIQPFQRLDIHSEGEAIAEPVTISYVSMQALGTAKRPKGLTGSGEVLAITLKISVAADAPEPIKFRHPRSQAKLTIKQDTDNASFVMSDSLSFTVAPGKSMDLVLYFSNPKIRTVDMAIELPGNMIDRGSGTIEILLPKGSNYRPKPATRPAASQPASESKPAAGSAGNPE